jgi:hypothetical protein
VAQAARARWVMSLRLFHEQRLLRALSRGPDRRPQVARQLPVGLDVVGRFLFAKWQYPVTSAPFTTNVVQLIDMQIATKTDVQNAARDLQSAADDQNRRDACRRDWHFARAGEADQMTIAQRTMRETPRAVNRIDPS